MQLAFLLYDRFAALDIVGPFDVLSRIPGAESVFVAERPGPVPNENGACSIVAEAGLDDVTAPDVVVVPGARTTADVLAQEPLVEWLRAVHPGTAYTTSVCTGALLLGAAGLLDGVPATTHWLARDELRALGADVRAERVVIDGRIVTAAGVSAGIDMGLRLLQVMNGDAVAQAVQLGLEYDPQPPFDCGSREKAAPETIELVTAVQAQVAATG